jgi:hypothetical protein
VAPPPGEPTERDKRQSHLKPEPATLSRRQSSWNSVRHAVSSFQSG